MRQALRFLALAAVGYGVFAAGALLLTTLFPYSFNTIDWPAGSLVALPFAATELLRAGQGKTVGFLRRLGVAAAIMLGAVLVTTVLVDAAGLRQNRKVYPQPPWYLTREGFTTVGVTLGLFAGGLLTVMLMWGREAPQSPASRDQ